MFRNIVVAIDGSATANRGLKVAVAMAREQKTRLHVIHVIEDARLPVSGEAALYIPEEYVKSIAEMQRKVGRAVLDKAEALAGKEGVTVNAVLARFAGQSAARAILREARKLHADLIVLGTHGRRGLARLVTGSDAEEVLRESPVPVLLVRASERRERAPKAAKPRSVDATTAPVETLRVGPVFP
jgi:nucleotide-binding universal stress UspA family protein